MACGVAALLWTCRGAPLGTAVADDYYFLTVRTFLPIRPFDSMSVPFYWRPLSRQAWFGLIGPLTLSAPWAVAALHLVLLAAIAALIHRTARRAFPAPLAAAIAIAPLLSEPARVLLAWPSAAQHLLPAFFAALAVHEAVADRAWSAGLAALGAVLSNESGVLVLPALPAIAWLRTRRLGVLGRWTLTALGVAALWGIGYAIALRNGVELPASHGHGPTPGALPQLFARASLALLNLEDRAPGVVGGFLAAHLLLVLAASILLARRAARPRRASWRPVVGLGVAWFLLGTALLWFVLPDWNSWRAWYPALGLLVALTVLLAVAWPPLGAAFVALRLAALLLAPPAPAIVALQPPESTSKVSFVRLARMQRVVLSTRAALLDHAPHLPHGGAVRYWTTPRAVRLAFQDSLGVHVWYRDTTLSWRAFGGRAGLTSRVDAMLEFLDHQTSPAAFIPLEAIRAFQAAGLAAEAGRLSEADSLLGVAEREPGLRRGSFLAAVELNRATLSYRRGDLLEANRRAESSVALDPNNPSAWAFAAELAWRQNDRDAASEAVRRCLALEPGHPAALRLAAELGLR